MPAPVITVSQMRDWETASWAAGCDVAAVIRRAGLEVARVALENTRAGDRVLVLAGRGNNGADAREAAGAMGQRLVEVIDATDPGAALEPLTLALARKPALIVDGLFGIGLNRPLEGEWLRLVTTVNASSRPVLAVDVPSGLNADTGLVMGASIRASVTLTFGAAKAGLLNPTAWDQTGRLLVAPEIGLIPCPFHSELEWVLPSDFEDFPPRRSVASHKGTHGHLQVLAGSLGFHGAAILATHAAQRAGPGLITLTTTESAYPAVAPAIHSPMVRVWTEATRIPENAGALLFGPGLASEEISAAMRNHTRRLWETAEYPVVADASGLHWLQEDSRRMEPLRVMTPHAGEAARLLDITSTDVLADRPGAVRELSRRHNGCWVVLKGHQTLVGRSSGKLGVNSSGNPRLAQGGSGDALAGFLAGLVAQPELRRDVESTLRCAVFEHGAAADRLQQRARNWTIEELVVELSR